MAWPRWNGEPLPCPQCGPAKRFQTWTDDLGLPCGHCAGCKDSWYLVPCANCGWPRCTTGKSQACYRCKTLLTPRGNVQATLLEKITGLALLTAMVALGPISPRCEDERW